MLGYSLRVYKPKDSWSKLDLKEFRKQILSTGSLESAMDTVHETLCSELITLEDVKSPNFFNLLESTKAEHEEDWIILTGGYPTLFLTSGSLLTANDNSLGLHIENSKLQTDKVYIVEAWDLDY